MTATHSRCGKRSGANPLQRPNRAESEPGTIARGNAASKSWVPALNRMTALAVIAAGLAWAAAAFLGVSLI